MSQQNLDPLFKRAKGQPLQAPAHLATRVLAHLDERRRKRRLWIWQSISALSLGLCAIMAFVVISGPSAQFEATVFSPHVVNVEVDKLVPGQSIEAEVILPSNVQFFSPSFPELAEERSLRLDVNSKGEVQYVPFVVQGVESGKRKIRVKFYNKENNVVFEKAIEIDFKNPGSEG